jgi:hypothetical protein
MRKLNRIAALLVTVAIFALILRRVPLEGLMAALRDADYARFLVLMIPNTVFYFCWDTLVLAVVIRWFHGHVRYADLLPVRAASYVVGFFNTNLGRGALAAYLSRQLSAPFLQLGSTVLFLVLTEYTHLVAWAMVGVVGFSSKTSRELLWVPPAVALFWLVFLLYTKGGRPGVTPAAATAVAESEAVSKPLVVSGFSRTWAVLKPFVSRGSWSRHLARWVAAPRDWSLLRTFRIAPLERYVQIVLLRAPMFFFSLVIHYFAARTFGIAIPFAQMLVFLPVIFMLAALPVTVAHLGTTQAAWIFFFGAYAPAPQLLAFSLAAHLTFTATRAFLGLIFLPRVYADLVGHPTLRSTEPVRN